MQHLQPHPLGKPSSDCPEAECCCQHLLFAAMKCIIRTHNLQKLMKLVLLHPSQSWEAARMYLACTPGGLHARMYDEPTVYIHPCCDIVV